MALFSKFKKSEKEKTKQDKEELIVKKQEESTKGVLVKKEKKEKVVSKKSALVFDQGVLEFSHITEKATDLSKENQYIFKIFPRANKIQVKKAVEKLYNVDVLSVRTITIPSKKKGFGRMKGRKKGYKKAIVRIKKGQKIPVFGA